MLVDSFFFLLKVILKNRNVQQLKQKRGLGIIFFPLINKNKHHRVHGCHRSCEVVFNQNLCGIYPRVGKPAPHKCILDWAYMSVFNGCIWKYNGFGKKVERAASRIKIFGLLGTITKLGVGPAQICNGSRR